MNNVIKTGAPAFITVFFALTFMFGAVSHANADWSSGGGSGSSTGTCCSTGGGGSSWSGGGGGYVPYTPPSTPVPPSCTLSASTANTDGTQDVSLSWSTSNASSVTIDTLGGVATNGSQTVHPTGTQTYVLHAYGNGGSVTCSKTVVVVVRPAPTCTISAAPTYITQGQNAIITWSSTNAQSGTITNLGSVALSGWQNVSPSQSTTYTGTFLGQNGQTVTCSATLAVTPIVNYCPSGYTGTYPNCVPPVYNNAPSCTIYISNNQYNTYNNNTYNNNYNQYGYGYNQNQYNNQYNNQPVTITWSSQNAQNGWINNGVGSVNLSGTQVVYPTANTTYTGTFVGYNGQTVNCSVTVNNYNPPVIPPPVYPTTPYVTLTQVPYTGLDLGPVGTFLYWAFLVVWCFFAAYLIAVKKVHVAIARTMKTFLFGSTTAVVAPTAAHAVASTPPQTSSDFDVIVNTLRSMLEGQGSAIAHSTPAHTVVEKKVDAIDDFVMSQINRKARA